jgi:hypothetical protein
MTPLLTPLLTPIATPVHYELMVVNASALDIIKPLALLNTEFYQRFQNFHSEWCRSLILAKHPNAHLRWEVTNPAAAVDLKPVQLLTLTRGILDNDLAMIFTVNQSWLLEFGASLGKYLFGRNGLCKPYQKLVIEAVIKADADQVMAALFQTTPTMLSEILSVYPAQIPVTHGTHRYSPPSYVDPIAGHLFLDKNPRCVAHLKTLPGTEQLVRDIKYSPTAVLTPAPLAFYRHLSRKLDQFYDRHLISMGTYRAHATAESIVSRAVAEAEAQGYVVDFDKFCNDIGQPIRGPWSK